MKPRLLDLCCCQGGAACGHTRPCEACLQAGGCAVEVDEQAIRVSKTYG